MFDEAITDLKDELGEYEHPTYDLIEKILTRAVETFTNTARFALQERLRELEAFKADDEAHDLDDDERDERAHMTPAEVFPLRMVRADR